MIHSYKSNKINLYNDTIEFKSEEKSQKTLLRIN